MLIEHTLFFLVIEVLLNQCGRDTIFVQVFPVRSKVTCILQPQADD